MISVFTPLSASGNQYIYSAYETLKAQTLTDWEWIVLENHGGVLPKNIRKDPRVKLAGDALLQGIGALKRRCCDLSSGEYLFEFDHDDLLHETALEKAMAAFDAGADFVFSDTAEFIDRTWKPNVYGPEFGWSNYPVEFQGHALLAQPNPPVTAQNIRLIDWSPNHFRAFRKDAYYAVGGHNPELHVGDDHDLMLRFFLKGKVFHHVKECLYFYRVHGKQTTNANVGNARIRQVTEALYDKHIFDLAERFCSHVTLDSGPQIKRALPLSKIDLCGAIDTYKDYLPIDKTLGHDLDEDWDIATDSVGVLRAFDAIEHLKDPVHTMSEAHRVLAPGGFLLIQVPSTTGPMIRTPAMDGGEFHWVASAGRGAHQDPTHVSFWNENSFWYYTKRSHARYIPHSTARFQVSKLRTFYPSDFHQQHSIPYVEAHLIALKDGYVPMGPVEI